MSSSFWSPWERLPERTCAPRSQADQVHHFAGLASASFSGKRRRSFACQPRCALHRGRIESLTVKRRKDAGDLEGSADSLADDRRRRQAGDILVRRAGPGRSPGGTRR